LRCLRMPEALRSSLGRGFLGVRICGEESSVTATAAELSGDCVAVVAVGDYVCRSFVELGLVPSICVVDGVTRRTLLQPWVGDRFSYIYECTNPRSHICLEAVERLREAVRTSAPGRGALVLVRGEEDLLALAALAEVPDGWCVVYGIPGCGVEVVPVDSYVRYVARRILELFEEVELAEAPGSGGAR
jgi:uncharacterized protein (UPF0218 family)